MSCKIHNNSEYDISEMKPLVRNLYGFAKDKFGFKKPPSINFVSDQANHPMLGKTAHYDPSSMEVTIYVDGRHPKDMMRSIAHELVHHFQNEKGMFGDGYIAGKGYAQKDPHLRKMEEEAYLEGNMCFRDWEDQYKSKNKDIFYERRIRKMSTKKWKNKELNGLLNERWGFSMNLDKLSENKDPETGEEVPEPSYDEEQTTATMGPDSPAWKSFVATYGRPPRQLREEAGIEEMQESVELSIGDVAEKQSKLKYAIINAIKETTGLTLRPENVSDVVNTALAAVAEYSTTRQAAVKQLSQTPSSESTDEN